MRHRITSFRCVEAVKKMSFCGAERKTCNAVNIRQTSLLRTKANHPHTRQSSITRATSAQGGTTKAATPDVLNPILPRLEAIASSSGSIACRSALTRAAEASYVAGRLLLCELVQTHSDGEAAGAALRRVTRRVERVQRMVSCGWPLALAKLASLPPLVAP